jgi:drug/metabolite transporter (DMT)-like permease
MINRAFLYIITGAMLWGTIGIYVKTLYSFGFSAMEVVTLRAFTAAIILTIYLAATAPKQLKLKKWTDLKYFIGTGILSIIFFNYCMFKTIELASLPVSAALLYTAPAFVIILSFFLFKEAITKRKMLALFATLLGTVLVVELFPFNAKSIPLFTIIIGLGSGIGYAFYSIFSKFALEKYNSLVITTYTFVVAALALLPFFSFQTHAALLVDVKVLLYAFGLGFLPTAIAYIIYTLGLQKTEASNASLLTTIEPVVATLIGIFMFQEDFHVVQAIGMGCIIGAVILIQIELPKRKRNRKMHVG